VAAARAAGIAEVYVSARRFEPGLPQTSWPGAAELLGLGAELLAWPTASAAARAEFDERCRPAGLVVQCTSAGMQGKDSGEPLAGLVPWAALSVDTLAYDLIYAPLETPFLRVAREAGRRTAHGLNMLVGQAALSVEIWLGQKPPAEPLLAAALAELERRKRS
jgi:shikimate 5-dehydrogenase